MAWQDVIGNIPQQVEELQVESTSPFLHYKRGANDAWNLLRYFERNVQRTTVYGKSYQAHLANLRASAAWRAASARVSAANRAPELALGDDNVHG